MEKHWLVRPKTIRRLKIALYAILAASVLLQLFFHVHGKYGIDGTFGFNAWFGMGTCVLMVVAAKAVGVLIGRKDTYYD